MKTKTTAEHGVELTYILITCGHRCSAVLPVPVEPVVENTLDTSSGGIQQEEKGTSGGLVPLTSQVRPHILFFWVNLWLKAYLCILPSEHGCEQVVVGP